MTDFTLPQNLTQEQIAGKCGTTKTYMSRIENNASDIRLSMLMRIVREGFGGLPETIGGRVTVTAKTTNTGHTQSP